MAKSTGRFQSYGLRTLVTLFVALCILPVWGYSLFVSWQYARTTRAALEADGVATAKVLAASAEFRVQALDGALRALSLSEAALKGDSGQLYVQALAFAKAQDVVIGYGDGRNVQIFNTNLPYGTPLPPASVASVKEAIASQRIQVSDLIFGNVSQFWLIAITHPLKQANGEDSVLVLAFDSQKHLGEVLQSVELPPGWIAAIVDGNRRIAARRPNPEFVGQLAQETVAPLIGNRIPGQMRAKTIQGEDALVFSHPVEQTGWTVLVGVPEAIIASSVQNHVSTTLMIGLIIFLMSVALSIFTADRFSKKFESLSQLALAYRNRAMAFSTRQYRVRELQELQRTLLFAHDERDRSEAMLRGLLADKELLMQEVHHRVKNSLQLVRGVLSLQARSTINTEAKEALEAASARIITIANVHHHLYLGDNISEILADDYFTQLTKQLAESLFPAESDRRIRVKAPHVPVRTDAMTSLGLITTELVTNSAKYGAGLIDVQFHIDQPRGEGVATAVLAVGDRGAGFPENFAFDKTGGLGSRLIDNLVRSVGGTIEIRNRKIGSRVVVRFPI